MRHGWEGVVLKLFRAKDFVFTVTGAEQVTERYRRVHFTDGGLLELIGVHPTMWVRLWFDNAGRPHQRAYTLVDPDVEAGTFRLEFALHDGCASDWSRKCEPGDTIEATVQGTGFEVPDPLPQRMLVIGDPASLPAINSLLEVAPKVPTTIWFETTHDLDHKLPFRIDPDHHDLRTVPRADLVENVKADLRDLAGPDPFVWIACDTATTRTLTSYVLKDLAVPKHRVKSLGYWKAA
ncbi:siderophore-interacting protein [Kribbella kalugense]|uniref:NADPH-dependent ferric siderophore reductase n=1 Tax=Kribbella kalugense TaxID=2512221 RepID=A0A4V3G7H0_9ACTN|nr:siderophore-interacting protein [Kribbella kalugense]TDW18884.1 NADPH-dependent ferric siderophore reductase [Kribbella kalugense]